ncbi:hypothetical protein PPBDW_I20673 [Photobacterium kishitanii]|nr:hypothetical protein PPBDW_I20673 [Photobacterium kishitanii]
MPNLIHCLYLDSFLLLCLRVSAREYDAVDYFTYIYAPFVEYSLIFITLLYSTIKKAQRMLSLKIFIIFI